MVLNFVTHRHNIDNIRADHPAVHRAGSRLRRTRHLPVLRLGRAEPCRAAADPRSTGARRADHRRIPPAAGRRRQSVQADLRHPRLLRGTAEGLHGRLGQRIPRHHPDGTALPCHSARQLPVQFPNVREHSLRHIWLRIVRLQPLPLGDAWMPEPCVPGEGEGERDSRRAAARRSPHRRCRRHRSGSVPSRHGTT